jgi:predicted DNA-binding transcriptional regulator AlpA
MTDGQIAKRYLRTPEAAQYVRLSSSTLEKMRCRGGGPIFHKAGRKAVVYELDELDAWLKDGCRRSTSDPGRN